MKTSAVISQRFLSAWPLLFVFLSSCVEVTDLEEQTEVPNELTMPAKAQGRSQVQIQALDQPNQYLILLRAAEGINRVYRRSLSDSDLAAESVITKPSGDDLYRDTQVQSSRTYEYSFVTENESGIHLVQKEVVQVPSDFVCNSAIELNPQLIQSLAKYNRIYLGKGALLRTLGQNIKLNLSELHSDNAMIESFTSGTRGTYHGPGHSGGKVEIFAKKAVGKLRLNMRGQDGYNASQISSNETAQAVAKFLTPKAMNGGQMIIETEELMPLFRKPKPVHSAIGQPGGGSGSVFGLIENAQEFVLEITLEAGQAGQDAPSALQ